MKSSFEAMPNSTPEPHRPDDAREPTYEEVLQEAEDSMNADIAASKEKPSKLEMSGMLQLTASDAARAAVAENLKEAMALSESPEGVETLLVNAAVEHVRKEIDTSEDFDKMHENPMVQKLYANVNASIRHEVVVALKTEIERKLDTAKGADEFEKLNAILEIIDKAER